MISQIHCLYTVTSVSYIFFATPSNFSVGTELYNSHKILTDVSLALVSLNMISNHKGSTIVLTPDYLYSHIEFIPLLAPNATTWSFSLVALVFNAIPSELQEAMQLGGGGGGGVHFA